MDLKAVNLTDKKLRKVFDSTHHGAGMPLERRLAPAIEAGFVGQHLDKNPVAHPGMTDVGFDFCDFHGL